MYVIITATIDDSIGQYKLIPVLLTLTINYCKMYRKTQNYNLLNYYKVEYTL